MMFQLIHNFTRVKYDASIFIIIFCLASPITTAGVDDDIDLNCPLRNTPLLRCDSYSWYVEEDRALNVEYKILFKAIDKNNRSLLKNTQRKWIKWRDQRCVTAQEKVNRKLGSFGASLHDDCIIQLTSQRTFELRQFIKNTENAANKKFEFSRKNEVVDESDTIDEN